MAPPDPGSAAEPRVRLRLEPYGEALVPAVRAFNERLERAGALEYRFGTAPPKHPADGTVPPVHRETRLAVDEDGQVRGGIILQHQQFETVSGPQAVVNVQLPLSEGIIDRRYAFLGMWLLRTVQRAHPLVFAVGMGSEQQPLPKLLKAMRWSLRPVPFLVHVHRPRRFLREMPMLRRRPLHRAAGTIAAATGAGWLGLRLLGLWSAGRSGPLVGGPRLRATRETSFGAWADDVWRAARPQCSLVGVRDRATLAALYPADPSRYHCYRLADGARDVGWVVLLRTAMRESPAFGSLVVGTVLDAMAVPGYEGAVARAARRLCGALGVDLSLTNQLHAVWRQAFRGAGYLSGPSNYLFAASPALQAVIAQAGPDAAERIHLTRGDGDGRIHL